MEFILQLEMVTIACAKCGLTFALPKERRDRRIDEGRKVYCPSGHKNVWEKPERGPSTDELKAQIRDLKSQLVSKRHDDEMAEARALETPPAKAAAEALPDITPEDLENHAVLLFKPAFRTLDISGKYKCEWCDKAYQETWRLKKHMIAKHSDQMKRKLMEFRLLPAEERARQWMECYK